MLSNKPLLMLFSALSCYVGHASAQSLPDTTACPKNVETIATCYSARLPTGAYVFAAMPKNWRGDLMVFAHGGPHIVPPTATTSMTDLEKYAVSVKLGFAWIASSYRREGYGVRMAAEDTDDARQLFIERIAKPKRTILHGSPYGGLVGEKLLETQAQHYAGAMFNGGAMGGAFDADPAARATLTADGQPTGAAPVPVVSIHSFNDPQAAVEAQYEYRAAVQKAGHGARLVQAYTDEPAHTAQSWAELAAVIDALMQWVEKDVKPTPQSIAASCEKLRSAYEGPCRYHPAYEPKPYATRYARSAVR